MQGLVVSLKIVPEEFATNIEWIVTYSAKVELQSYKEDSEHKGQWRPMEASSLP